jgi:proton-translocating NADH-quinone oxidoreductase chain L
VSNPGPAELALIALALPLVAALLAALAGVTRYKNAAHLPVVAAFAAAACLAGYALVLVAASPGAAEGTAVTYASPALTWFDAGGLSVKFSVALDPLSAVMLLTVTFVATWIAIFSAGYMHHDSGYARYFSLVALFVFAMSLLVLADNFFLLLAGWEGVGVCSYLLVGYYYAKPSAAAAARKAFLVTRLGDVGFVLGIFLLWSIGDFKTDFASLFDHIAHHPETHAKLSVACLLLFCGAVGKSAQLPLYVWLPDAMEGPTPVSALIHAATMVTAGVYLLARCAPLFSLCPEVQLLVSLTGAATAFLAAFIALAQTDLKRVLAYSTVSQLGFMFMALGTGGLVPPGLAVTAALFHLVTHAFFKALLFLGSGSVMHAMGGVIDMRQFGGLRKLMPVTHLTFLCGALALSGVPVFAGFWSKDLILDVLFEAAESGHSALQSGYMVAMGLALVTAGMTAFYTFRAYFLTFWGTERVPHEAHGHAHESPASMTVPLVVLAVGAVFLGVALEPITHGFSQFVARTPELQLANEHAHPHATVDTPGAGGYVEPHLNLPMAGLGSAVALLGVLLAWRQYGAGGPEEIPHGMQAVSTLSRNKLYVDDLYWAFIVKPAEILAAIARQFDVAVGALARLFASLPELAAAGLRPLQNGLVQFYALGMVLGVAVYLTVIVLRSSP